MAFTATVIPVMIASPSDVMEERSVIREVLHDWNDINASTSGVMLQPVGWESHSFPSMGGRPQDIVNNQVLVGCDLLVGVFWTRLGSPTGVEDSGTVEEIKAHISAGRPAMIYFSGKPAVQELFDANQYSKLKSFRAWCEKNGLIREFVNIEEFRRQFSKHLHVTVSRDSYIQSTVATASGGSAWAPPPEKLSADARIMLKAAAVKQGSILKLKYLSGSHIQAGNELFGKDGAREYARWEAALVELLEEGLVVARGVKDQMFELTHKGWKLAERTQ